MDSNQISVQWEKFLHDKLPTDVQAVEVYTHKSDQFSVGLLNGEIEEYESSHTSGICLRADCGQVGYAYSEYPKQNPDELLQAAAENAHSVQNDDAPFMRFYAGEKQYASIPPIDQKLIEMTAADKIQVARELDAKALKLDPHVKRLENCVLSTSTSLTHLQNSLGLRVTQQRGYAIAYCTPIAEKNGEVKNGMAYDIASCVEDLDLDKIAREAVEETVSQFGAVSIPSGQYDAVIKNDAMSSLLSVFLSMFSAESAQKGLSLLADKVGQQIGSPIVNIADAPMHPLSMFPTAFDAEGVGTRNTLVVQDGVLLTLLHNRKTAQKDGVQTTGNAGKPSVSSPLTVSPTNFFLSPGTLDEQQLFSELGNGIYLTDFSGLHSGANSISGTFSLLSRGFRIENGARTYPVEQITVSGNFLELLASVIKIGSNLKFGMSSIGCPSVLVQGLQIAGS